MAPPRKRGRPSLPLVTSTKNLVAHANHKSPALVRIQSASGGADQTRHPASADMLHCLPRSFSEAAEKLVSLVQDAVHDRVTMFKVEMTNVQIGHTLADVVNTISEKARQDICEVVPLVEVREDDLPDNGCVSTYSSHHYCESLVHSVRAHFAFAEFDQRLIGTRSVCAPDKEATQLIYVFNYLETPAGRSDAHITPHSYNRLENGSVAKQRSSILGAELQQTLDSLDRAERELMEVTDMDVDFDLPSLPSPDMPLQLPEISLAHARRSVLHYPECDQPVVQGVEPTTSVHKTPNNRRAARKRKTQPEDQTEVDEPLDEASVPVVRTPMRSKGRKSLAALELPDDEIQSLLAFYLHLDATQSEQSRVALTGRYARMRYQRDVPAEAVFQLLARAPQQQQQAPSPAQELVEVEQQRDRALQVYNELNAAETEQSRVAFTLRYMSVQHRAKIDSKTLFGWLEPATKKRGKRYHEPIV